MSKEDKIIRAFALIEAGNRMTKYADNSKEFDDNTKDELKKAAALLEWLGGVCLKITLHKVN